MTRAALVTLLVAVACGAAAALPVPGSRPTVSGTLQVGSRLAAAPGSWSGRSTVAYAYGWYRCDPVGAHCSSIHGATRPTYTLVAKDAGQTIGLTVRVTDASGETAGYASLAGPIAPAASALAPTSQPTLTGAATVGSSLGVLAGTWTAAPASTATAWLRCNANGRLCAPIADVHGPTYAVTAADVGHTVVAEVTAVAAPGAPRASVQRGSVLSLDSAPAQATPGPVAVSAPTVAGVLQQGRQLTAAAGSWSGSGTIGYAFNWYRCDPLGAHCSSIHGATSPTYTLVPKDVGQTLGLTVRATDSTGTTAAFASLAGPIAPPTSPAAAAQPLVSGSPATGATLTATTGTWTQEPTSTTVAWLRCNENGRLCTAVAGATSATYPVAAADAGHTLVAVVRATFGAATLTVFSRATAPVS